MSREETFDRVLEVPSALVAARVPRRRNLRRLLVNTAVLLVAALVPCVVAEVVLRVLSPPADTPGLFVKMPTAAEYSGRPLAQGRLAGAPVALNRFGLRDREWSIGRAPGTYRVLVLGDSVTFGLGVRESESFPRVTEVLLNRERRPDRPSVEVLNFGVPGYNTVHELAQFEELGLALRPDMVVLGFLYNDVEPSTAQQASLRKNVVPATTPRLPALSTLARSLESDLNVAITDLKHHSLFVAWLSPRLGTLLRPLGVKGLGQVGEIKDHYRDSSPEWQWAQSALLELKRLCDANHIRLVIAIIPAMAQFTDAGYPIKEYHGAVSRFCRRHDVDCLDMLPAFWGLDGTELWVSLSDGHPNARAHRIAAEALAAYLAPLLPGAAARRPDSGAAGEKP